MRIVVINGVTGALQTANGRGCAGMKNGPTLPRFAWCAAPEGAFSSWGGPAKKMTPTLPRCAWCAAPEGPFSSWGGPAMKKALAGLVSGKGGRTCQLTSSIWLCR